MNFVPRIPVAFFTLAAASSAFAQVSRVRETPAQIDALFRAEISKLKTTRAAQVRCGVLTNASTGYPGVPAASVSGFYVDGRFLRLQPTIKLQIMVTTVSGFSVAYFADYPNPSFQAQYAKLSGRIGSRVCVDVTEVDNVLTMDPFSSVAL